MHHLVTQPARVAHRSVAGLAGAALLLAVSGCSAASPTASASSGASARPTASAPRATYSASPVSTPPSAPTGSSSEQLGPGYANDFYALAWPLGWSTTQPYPDGSLYTSPSTRSNFLLEHVALADYSLTAAGYVTTVVAKVESELGAKPESTEPFVLDDVPATLRIYHYTDYGHPRYALLVAIGRASTMFVPGGTGTMLVWTSDAGNETSDRATFEAVCASFLELGVDRP